MKNIGDFIKLTKPEMVCSVVEALVFQGYHLEEFLYSFRSFTKSQLIEKYRELIDSADEL